MEQSIINNGVKMIKTKQQWEYQKSTRLNGCVPHGLLSQSKVKFAGVDDMFQCTIQSLYNFTASRTLDLMIVRTKQRYNDKRSTYYNSKEMLRKNMGDEYFGKFEKKLYDRLDKTSKDCSKIHGGKLERDLKHNRVYANLDGTSVLNTKNWSYQDIPTTIPKALEKKKRGARRFDKNQEKKKKKGRTTQKVHLKKARRNEHGVRHKNQKLSIPPTVDVNKYFCNLTSVQLTEDHKYIFYLCQKFCPTPLYVNWAEFENDLDNWTFSIRWAYKLRNIERDPNSWLETSLVKNKVKTPILDSKCTALELYLELVRKDLLKDKTKKYVHDNIHPDHRKALNEMKQWDKEKGIIVRPYDKGDGIFIDEKESYRTRILQELDSPTYEQIQDKNVMEETVIKLITQWTIKWDVLEVMTPKLKAWIIPTESKKPGKLYINYKKHKPDQGYPGRMITSGSGSYTENLSAFTSVFLKLCQGTLEHCLLDINEFLYKLDTVNEQVLLKDKSKLMVSFDVVKMFPSIPKILGINECRKKLNNREDQSMPTACVIEALELTLDYNLSQFDDDWYRQTEGTAMGPHNSCEYADITMSWFDEIVMSDKNPYTKPNLWYRFRDDVWDAWTEGEEKLLEFFNWLNTLHPSIKFTLVYGETVEFLDTTVYVENGKICTKIYSKPSDTNAYLLPFSCHPDHISKNIPKGVARRMKKLNSDPQCAEEAKILYTQHLCERGYEGSFVADAFNEFESIDRKSLYSKDDSAASSSRAFPLVTQFNPGLPNVSKVLHKYKHVLQLDEDLCSVIKPSNIFASFRQPKNIKGLLTKSGFKSDSSAINSNETDEQRGSISCRKCLLCKFYLINDTQFVNYETRNKVYITKSITCTTKGVIYLVRDLVCKRSYVGSTIDTMRIRWANYKNHIKTNYQSCEVAKHVHSDLAVHPIDLDKYDEKLSAQFNVFLLDKVDLSGCKTTKSKRNKIQKVEGVWQSSLAALSNYGGLNKRNERKISNNRCNSRADFPPAFSGA